MMHDQDKFYGLRATLVLLTKNNVSFNIQSLLLQHLKTVTSQAAFLELAQIALDFGARAAAEGAIERLDSATAAPLRARAMRMWGLTDMPAATAPLAQPIPGRVAYVLYSSLPFLSTGYAIRSQALARALGQAGADVQCITRPGFPWDESPGILNRAAPNPVAYTDTVDGVPYHRLPAVTADWWDDYPAYVEAATDALVACLRDLRPAVVMAASNHVCALPALRAAQTLGLPLVYDMRGMWELSRAAREPDFMASPQFCYERALETAIATQADHVFALSPPMRKAMIKRDVAPDRITYLPNGCDLARFAPTAQGKTDRAISLRARLQIPANRPIIGYAGSFPAYEGLEDLIAASALLRDRQHDFHLVLVGDESGTGSHGLPRGQVLMDQIAALRLRERVLLTGRIDPASVPDFLSMFDLMVVPRRSLPVTETVAPLKPAEAMAAGKALIVSDVGGMEGLVDHESTGLVFAPSDPADLADALERLLGDPSLRARLGRNARRRAETDFDWRTIAERMSEVLFARKSPGGQP